MRSNLASLATARALAGSTRRLADATRNSTGRARGPTGVHNLAGVSWSHSPLYRQQTVERLSPAYEAPDDGNRPAKQSIAHVLLRLPAIQVVPHSPVLLSEARIALSRSAGTLAADVPRCPSRPAPPAPPTAQQLDALTRSAASAQWTAEEIQQIDARTPRYPSRPAPPVPAQAGHEPRAAHGPRSATFKPRGLLSALRALQRRVSALVSHARRSLWGRL